MAATIKPKRSTVTGNVPTTANIVQYEIAINTADKKIFTRDGADAIVQLASGNLVGLSDVAVSSPANGQSLTYNSTTGKWENSTVSGGGSSGVSSFNTRTGAVTLTSSDVTTALTFTPYNATNPSSYVDAAGARSAISVTQNLTYNSTTGVITGPDLTTKQDTLVSGTSIKTVNSTSLLGSGDVTLFSGGLIQVAVVASLPGSPNANTLYVVTG
jgi:hypothetical protein